MFVEPSASASRSQSFWVLLFRSLFWWRQHNVFFNAMCALFYIHTRNMRTYTQRIFVCEVHGLGNASRNKEETKYGGRKFCRSRKVFGMSKTATLLRINNAKQRGVNPSRLWNHYFYIWIHVLREMFRITMTGIVQLSFVKLPEGENNVTDSSAATLWNSVCVREIRLRHKHFFVITDKRLWTGISIFWTCVKHSNVLCKTHVDKPYERSRMFWYIVTRNKIK